MLPNTVQTIRSLLMAQPMLYSPRTQPPNSNYESQGDDVTTKRIVGVLEGEALETNLVWYSRIEF